jgi:predicted nuclease of predicted toxin-antitoxin system
MRFKIDENLHDDVALLLTAAGRDAETVHGEGLRGSDDTVVAQHCRDETRAIVTLDLDFADIRSNPPANYPGIVVLRVRDQSRGHVLGVMATVIDTLQREPLDGKLWIVSESSIRIRA